MTFCSLCRNILTQFRRLRPQFLDTNWRLKFCIKYFSIQCLDPLMDAGSRISCSDGACLAKLRWGHIVHRDELWAQVLRYKYGVSDEGSPPLLRKKNCSCSWVDQWIPKHKPHCSHFAHQVYEASPIFSCGVPLIMLICSEISVRSSGFSVEPS